MNEIIGIEFKEKKGYFYVKVADAIEAKMTFVFAGTHQIIIDHTEVNPENNGKGFGKKNGRKSRFICQRKRIKNSSFVSICKKSF